MATVDTTVSARQPSRSLAELVERENRRRRRRHLFLWASAAVVVVLGLAAWQALRPRPVPLTARFRMEPVVQGDLVREVRATGAVQPVTTVQVGAQTSGRIEAVDVDFNDPVKAGQILARFDLTSLRAQFAQVQATLAASRASLELAKADSEKAQRDLARAEQLWTQKILSDADHDTAANTARLADQRVKAAEATLAAQQAAATVVQTNVDYAVIRSPIDGVVVMRNVDPGQTVASGFQTPVLFQVAANLNRMRAIVPVDEADIGEVAIGQPAYFTVDAYPERVFQGVVTKVRNTPVTVQDVVTYGTEVEVSNPELLLKPGMTASMRIRTGLAKNVLRVPNAALRFTPPGEKSDDTPGVWVLDGDTLRRIAVRTGISDGEFTEVTPGPLAAGASVILDLTPEGRRAYGLAR